jgi:hypothetical protein
MVMPKLALTARRTTDDSAIHAPRSDVFEGRNAEADPFVGETTVLRIWHRPGSNRRINHTH